MSEQDNPKVVGLFGAPIYAANNEPNPEIIEDLERLLELAREGELASFAFAGLGLNDSLCVIVSGQYTPLKMRGAIAMLEDYMRDIQSDLEIIIPGPQGAA